MTAESLLAALVAVPSVSRDERAIADRLADLLQTEGLAVSRAGNSLWFEIGRGAPRLLLVSHLDTVPAGDGWTVDPHRAAWERDRLVGLGANDAKGSVAAMTMAAIALRGSRELPAGSLVVACVAEEEVGGGGIRAIRPHLGAIDAAVVGEPTSLEVCVAQRGMVVLRCVARGRGAHVAHGERGVNAIHAASRDISRLAAMSFGNDRRLGETVAQVTQVSGGRARNQVPDRCEFFVDVRTSPGMSPEAIVERVRAEIDAEVHLHSGRYLPCATDESHPVVQAALAAAGRMAGVGSRTTSDWAFLSDVPAVKVGPGDTARSHGPDEYLTRDELRSGEAFFRRFVPDCLARLRAWTPPAGRPGPGGPDAEPAASTEAGFDRPARPGADR